MDTVLREGLAGHSDSQVWDSTRRAGRFLITQDRDFSDPRRFGPGTHHGPLLVRLKEPGRDAIIRSVERVFRTEDVSLWPGCFVVLTEHKVRVIAPG